MECFSAILLFDAFSARKRNRVVHWITVTAVAFLDATLLNFAATTMLFYWFWLKLELESNKTKLNQIKPEGRSLS